MSYILHRRRTRINNLQGAGGIAFNPLAYTAGRPWDGADGGDSTNEVEHSSLNGIVSRPQFGAWFVNDKLTLVAAYVQTGDKDKFYRHGSAKNLGVGSGLVFSVQYQF